MSDVSRARDPENRSRKDCVCGGHSTGDAKKSKQHHGTAMRLLHRLGRLLKLKKSYQ